MSRWADERAAWSLLLGLLLGSRAVTFADLTHEGEPETKGQEIMSAVRAWGDAREQLGRVHLCYDAIERLTGGAP